MLEVADAFAEQFARDRARLKRALRLVTPAHAPQVIATVLGSGSVNAEWAALYTSLFLDIGQEFAGRMGETLAQTAPIKVTPRYDAPTARARILRYTARYVQQRVTDMLRATTTRVVGGFASASPPPTPPRKVAPLAAGWTDEAVDAVLDDIYQGLIDEGASYLAETEAVKAGNIGMWAGAGAVEAGGLEKQKVWVPIIDSRTREWHRDMDGVIAGLDEPFLVGDELMLFPGDDSLGATPANIANCRCIAYYLWGQSPKSVTAQRVFWEDWAELDTKQGWSEDDHPRDERGRFTDAGGGGVDTFDLGGGSAGVRAHEDAVTAAAQARYQDRAAARYRPDDYADRWQQAPEGGFKTADAARTWLNRYHPATTWDINDLHDRAAQKFTEAADKLWDKYPGVGATVHVVGVGPVQDMGELAHFAPDPQGGGDIQLSERIWSREGSWTTMALLRAFSPPDWTPGGAPPNTATTLQHEFGHAYEAWADRYAPDKKTWTAFITSKSNITDSKVSGYGSASLKERGDTREQFADAFMAREQGLIPDNSLVRLLDDVITTEAKASAGGGQ